MYVCNELSANADDVVCIAYAMKLLFHVEQLVKGCHVESRNGHSEAMESTL